MPRESDTTSIENTTSFDCFVNNFKDFLAIIISSLIILILSYQNYELNLQLEGFMIQMSVLAIGKFVCLPFFVLRIVIFDKKFRKHLRKYRKEVLKYGTRFEFSTIYFFFSAVLSVLENGLFLFVLFYWSPGMLLMIYHFSLIFTPILKRVFLKIPIYKHALFGLVISFFFAGLISACLFSLERLYFGQENLLQLYLLVLLAGLIKSLRLVYEKWMNDNFHTSNFRMNGLEGLFSIIVLALFQMVMYFLDQKFFNIIPILINVFKNNNWLISFGVLLILVCINEILLTSIMKKRYLTNSFFDFCLVSTGVLAEMSINFYRLTNYDFFLFSLFSVLRFLFYLGFTFGVLIIHEFIAIKWWNLDKNLKKYRIKNQLEENVIMKEEYSIMGEHK